MTRDGALKSLGRAANFLGHRLIGKLLGLLKVCCARALAHPFAQLVELVVGLPIGAVSPSHQPNQIGLNDDGIG